MTHVDSNKKAVSGSRTARLFRNGRNQAVRLPKEYEFDADEVFIRKEGDALVLTPRPRSWDDYFSHASRLSEDFPDTIEDFPLKKLDPF